MGNEHHIWWAGNVSVLPCKHPHVYNQVLLKNIPEHACLIRATPWAVHGSSVHEIFEARIWEWVTISYSRGSSQSRDQTHISSVSYFGRRILYH